jgi:WhiB family redox-sensing transcriptional regulator
VIPGKPPVVEAPTLPWDPLGWWVLDAACQNKEPDIFYPEDEGDEIAIKRAKRICASCPVKAECGEYAIRRDEEYGAWGGMDRDERLAEAARRRQLQLAS